ncbi:hypothetical protein NLI96_g3489 [Meripilus lineatus]|uniref:Uncharacterized protein n=1 Tax=Meripilus lineatus TaxID=2056292 RepID=A0AAD5VBH1_9APHY|nr:hypothetical protein NLI96_g3489 [Physisporinus lineatus]
MYAPLPALHVLTRIFSRVVRNEHRRSSQSDQISMKPHVRKEAAHTISTLNVVEDPWAVVFVCTDLCPGDRQLDAMQTTTDYVSICEDVSSVGMVQLPALGNAETACLDDIPVVLKQQRRRAMNALHVSSVPCTATGEDHLDIGSPTSPGELEGAETQAHISQASVRLVFRAFVHLATHSDDIIAKGTPLLKHDGIAKGLRFAHPKLGPTGVVLRILEPLSANAADDNSDPSLSENFSRSSSLATTRTTTDEDFTERLADDGLDRKIDEEDPVNRTSDIMLMGRFQYRGSEQSATPISKNVRQRTEGDIQEPAQSFATSVEDPLHDPLIHFPDTLFTPTAHPTPRNKLSLVVILKDQGLVQVRGSSCEPFDQMNGGTEPRRACEIIVPLDPTAQSRVMDAGYNVAEGSLAVFADPTSSHAPQNIPLNLSETQSAHHLFTLDHLHNASTFDVSYPPVLAWGKRAAGKSGVRLPRPRPPPPPCQGGSGREGAPGKEPVPPADVPQVSEEPECSDGLDGRGGGDDPCVRIDSSRLRLRESENAEEPICGCCPTCSKSLSRAFKALRGLLQGRNYSHAGNSNA